MEYNEIEGDLVELAKWGGFHAVAHGCNCFCTMGAGIAPVMAKAFGCNKFEKEKPQYRGDRSKLGTIDAFEMANGYADPIVVINAYSQYYYGRNHKDGKKNPLDYDALKSCFQEINTLCKGAHLGLPKIGCGLAGGDWNRVKAMIQEYLPDVKKVTVVIYNK